MTTVEHSPRAVLARCLLAALMIPVSAALLSSRAQAQSMNYGELEQLFGEPVTTSATGSPQRTSEAPADMTIVTADEIRRSGATTIPDVLKRIAGVEVRQYSLTDAEVSIRGYDQPSSARLLVLINGRQVYNDSYGFTTWASLPVQISEIRQIEIVRGPNTALFGFNAVSGVVNIITYDPLNDDANTATAQAGTQAQLRGSGIVTLHLDDNFGLRLSGGVYRANEYSAKSLPDISTRSNFGHAVSADSRYQILPDVELTGEATWSRIRQLEVIAPGSISEIGYTSYSFKIGGVANTSLGLVSLDAYRNNIDENVGGFVQIDNTIYVVQANDLVKLDNDNIIRIGAEYRHNRAEAGMLFNGDDVGEQVYAASAMWNWQINPTLALTNAARVDYLALYRHGPWSSSAPFTLAEYNAGKHTGVSFNSGLIWKAGDADTFRLLASRGVQAPSLIAYGEAGGGPAGGPSSGPTGASGGIYGDPNLALATVMNYEIDYDRRLEDLSSVLRFAAFHQETSDMFAMASASPDNRSETIGSSRAYGGEIEFKGSSSDNFRWDASYSLALIHDDLLTDRGTSLTSPSDPQHGTPVSTINLGGGYDWDRFELDATLRWQSSYQDIVSTNITQGLVRHDIPNFVTLDARLGYRLTDAFEVALDVDQLNAATIRQTASVPVERRIFVTLAEDF